MRGEDSQQFNLKGSGWYWNGDESFEKSMTETKQNCSFHEDTPY